MALSTILSLVLFSIYTLVTPQPTSDVPNFDLFYCLHDTGNYTNNSDFQANLNHVFSTLTAGDGNGYGFYNQSYGGDGQLGDIDKVNAIAQCRGDVSKDVCRDCLNNATKRIVQVCPEQKDAGGWYESCMLRYSNRSMAGGAVEVPRTLLTWSTQSASDVDAFVKALQDLLIGLKTRAASGGGLEYAAGSTGGPAFSTIYALVQCTADVSQINCTTCLDSAFAQIQSFSYGKLAARLIDGNCNFMYETGRMFFDDPVNGTPISPPLNSPPESVQKGRGSKKSRTTVVIVVVSIAFVSVLLIISFVFLRIRKKKKFEVIGDVSSSERGTERIERPEFSQYSFEMIKVATNNFSEANELGRGGFGPVYKGKLVDGRDVAIKRLSTGSGQGDLEFKNEVALVAKLQHRNLVRLLGFCLETSERLLIYELVPNGSLDHIIFDPRKRADLDWDTRYKIIAGIARGLLYLHEDSRLRVIHRDLKASNILLDEKMNPKIADFGTARPLLVDQTRDNTNRIVGTYGYMAPEYVQRGRFSVKSDVFSFGVLLLEIVSGRKNIFRNGEQTEILLSYVWKNWRDRTSLSIVDPMPRHRPGSEIIGYIHIALLCVQENVANRPTMDKIVFMLNSNSLSLPVPSEPAFVTDHSNNNIIRSGVLRSNCNTYNGPAQASVNEASITELYPR